jgi:hypothetical protein
MTGQEIRDIGYLAWRDPDAWMEKMSGPRWDSLVKEENRYFKDLLHKTTDAKTITKFKSELIDASRHYDLECFQAGPIKITPLSAFALQWRFETEPLAKRRSVGDIYVTPKYIWTVADIGHGSEKFQLTCIDATTHHELYKRTTVGPSIASAANHLYFLGVNHRLWSNTLYMCDAATGAHKVLIYEEKDPHYNLTLERGANNTIFLVREDSGKTDAFLVEGKTLKPIAKGSAKQIPVSKDFYFSRDVNSDIYSSSKGQQIKDGTPYWGWISRDGKDTLYLTRRLGDLILWYNGNRIYAQHCGSVTTGNYGSEMEDPVFRCDNGTGPPFSLHWDIKTKKLHKGAKKHGFQLQTHYVGAASSDGVKVRGTILSKDSNLKGLVGVGYGAYGMPVSCANAYKSWAPLLNRGWGILFTYIRGGGDDSDAWAQAGRLHGRVHTRDDFLALVKAAQQKHNIGPEKTVIYGRSAGGLLMGASINAVPDGSLFQTVYTEVPYVDILRTTTNPDLPLTRMEYNEFGDPLHHVEDFAFYVDFSPADLAVTLKAPNILVIARTGLNDSQVYAYEPAKWIRRLRKGGGKEKVIGIAEDEGHFYSPHVAAQAKAEDLAIIYSVASGVF